MQVVQHVEVEKRGAEVESKRPYATVEQKCQEVAILKPLESWLSWIGTAIILAIGYLFLGIYIPYKELKYQTTQPSQDTDK
jgi:hypothetical protein